MRRLGMAAAAAGAATLVLWLAGRSVLPAPPLAHPGSWPAWWTGAGPAVALFATLRIVLVVVGLIWSLLAALLLVARAVLAGGRCGSGLARLLLGAAGRWGRMIGLRGVLRVGVGMAVPGAGLTLGTSMASAAPTPSAAPAARTAPTTPDSTAPDGTSAEVPPPAPVLVGPSGPDGGTWNPAPSTTGSHPSPAPAPVTIEPGAAPAAGPPGSATPTTSAGVSDTTPTTSGGASDTTAPVGRARPAATTPTTAVPAPTTTPGAITSMKGPPRAAPTPAYRRSSGEATSAGSLPGSPEPDPGPSSATRTRPAPGSSSSASSASGGAVWTVRPGDDFWTIAETVVDATPGDRAPAPAVGRYWVRLIAANRSRLPDPADPSLLFPGDVLVLPPP